MAVSEEQEIDQVRIEAGGIEVVDYDVLFHYLSILI